MEQMTRGKFLTMTTWGLDDDAAFVEVLKTKNKSKADCIRDGEYLCRSKEIIKPWFNFGNGTMKDFLMYIKDNRDNLWMIELV